MYNMSEFRINMFSFSIKTYHCNQMYGKTMATVFIEKIIDILRNDSFDVIESVIYSHLPVSL